MKKRDTQRIEWIKKYLLEEELDALILKLPENIVMSMGVWPLAGYSYAIITADKGPLSLIAPSSEDSEMGDCWAESVSFFIWPKLGMPDPQESIKMLIKEVMHREKLSHARIGYEGSCENVAPPYNSSEPRVTCEASVKFLKNILPDANWVDASPILEKLKSRKTSLDLERLRTTHLITDLGIDRFHRAVEPGKSDAELAAEIYTECCTKGVEVDGVEHVLVFPQISSGSNNASRSWRPIVTTGKRRSQAGDIVLLEMAVCVDGYWSDITRVKVAGSATEEQIAIASVVQEAQQAALDSIASGVKAHIVDSAARKVLVNSGYANDIVHLTGHGVGFKYHESEPFLLEGNQQELMEGHVFSVEPGLYNPDWGGIRYEDNVAITPLGVEVLTKSPKLI